MFGPYAFTLNYQIWKKYFLFYRFIFSLFIKRWKQIYIVVSSPYLLPLLGGEMFLEKMFLALFNKH